MTSDAGKILVLQHVFLAFACGGRVGIRGQGRRRVGGGVDGGVAHGGFELVAGVGAFEVGEGGGEPGWGLGLWDERGDG